jgi:pimeloyl-ACP methyl ester carboxylesterase
MTTPTIYKSAAGEQAVMAHYDKTLATWPVPYSTLTVSTRHGETFVIASGPNDSPPVLLLHGAASNALAWIGEIEAYSRMLRVYAVDLPGEPGRSSHNRPAWSGPAYVEWMEDVLDGLGLDKAALVGISQGGWTALKFATAQTERVTRLVLLAPAGVTLASASFLLRAIPLSLLGRRGGEAINRITFGNQPIHPAAVAYMNLIMTHFKPRIGALPNFTDAELSRLTMPTLLIVGAQDALYPSAKTAARLERLAPNLTVRMLPEMGHVLHGLSGEIVPFLAVEHAEFALDTA